MPIMTNHAKHRLKERGGVKKSSMEKIVERALSEGIPHCKTKGRLNKWITKLYFYNQTANNIKIYGEKAYVFADEKLITVLNVPANLTKDLEKMIKQ